MQYKKLMQKIMLELNSYKQEVDDLVASYTEEKTKREKQLQSMKGKYTEDYMQEERLNWKPKIDYGKLISLARETHQKITNSYFNEIRVELDKYFQAPVEPGFASTVSAIKTVGVTLSNREFELLQGASGGYWWRRLLNELAVSRTKTEQVVTLESGEMKRDEKETMTPYGGIELPDIEKVYDALQNARNAAGIALEGYCGGEYELKSFVFPEAMNALQISQMATSLRCFESQHHPYVAFTEIMDSIESTIPKKKKKEILTEDDKKLIDTLIDSKYQITANENAAKIALADERLAEILQLDERYGDAVQKALAEAGKNEQ